MCMFSFLLINIPVLVIGVNDLFMDWDGGDNITYPNYHILVDIIHQPF